LKQRKGIVVRVVVLGNNGQNTKLEWVVQGASAKQNYSSHRHDALFFNTQIATSLSACRGAWWTH
jgi:hypothetical protein